MEELLDFVLRGNGWNEGRCWKFGSHGNSLEGENMAGQELVVQLGVVGVFGFQASEKWMDEMSVWLFENLGFNLTPTLCFSFSFFFPNWIHISIFYLEHLTKQRCTFSFLHNSIGNLLPYLISSSYIYEHDNCLFNIAISLSMYIIYGTYYLYYNNMIIPLIWSFFIKQFVYAINGLHPRGRDGYEIVKIQSK